MLTPPDAIVAVLVPFAKLFTNPTWRKAQVLVVGAILTPGQRTVTAALRVMGRSDHRDYARYHEVLNRAVWSPRQAARILLMLLLQHLDHGDDPLVFGIDETLERRRGPRINTRGIYRDAVRSSRHQLVRASGLRWISLMWLGPAGAHGAGAIGTVPPTAGTPAQETHRLGQADDTATASLAAATPAGAGGRQRLRRAGPAPPLPVPPGTRHPDRPFAHGRRPVCPSASPSAGTERSSAAQRRAAALAQSPP